LSARAQTGPTDVPNAGPNAVPALELKVASEPWEFEEIHRLNYRTFVEEIPQHASNDDGRLVDRFHDENTYCIATSAGRVVGMVCFRGRRPFSLDRKLPDLDTYLPENRRVCEIRLLAVEKAFRGTRTTAKLFSFLAQEAIARGFDCAVISGTTRQLALYRHLGFVPFGPLVGSGEARFQPMLLTLEALRRSAGRALGPMPVPASEPATPTNFLPGPVAVEPTVARAFQGTPVSHRSAQFLADFQALRRRLCALADAAHVEVMVGSGTLANEVVAAQLAALDRPGLILSHGEFGERLVDHARRQGLRFAVLRGEWGSAFRRDEVSDFLDQHRGAGWLWFVHCETSTGVMNDLAFLAGECAARGIEPCVDAISSLGVVPVRLREVYLASGVSGKGLAAYPGLGLVFHRQPVGRSERIPRYLDLGTYADHDGVPFTQSSNLVYALAAALEQTDGGQRGEALVADAGWLRRALREIGYAILADDEVTSPAVTTLVLPRGWRSVDLGGELEQAGFLVSYRSEYLVRRNWLQICLMGPYSRAGLEALLARLERAARGRG
jgi:aspartate aminotransferase-like enzyme/GNAT superfamily N-acetyltransferase